MSDKETEEPKREMFSGPMAFLGGIRGNLEALDAVLAVCRAEGVGAYFALGDLVFGGSDPLGVWKRLQEIHARLSRGPSDLALAALPEERLRRGTPQEKQAAELFLRTRKELGELILERVKRLPDILRIELNDGREIAAMAGSPADPLEALSHDMTDDELLALLGDDPADVFLSGGSSVAFVRDVKGLLLASTGRVGDAPDADRAAHFALFDPSLPPDAQLTTRWVRY